MLPFHVPLVEPDVLNQGIRLSDRGFPQQFDYSHGRGRVVPAWPSELVLPQLLVRVTVRVSFGPRTLCFRQSHWRSRFITW